MLATGASAQQFDGIYRPAGDDFRGWSCADRDIGFDGGAVAILDGYLEGVENRCELTSPQPTSNGTTYTAVCSAEGSEYRETVTIAPASDGVSLTRNGRTVEWVQCDAENAASDTQGSASTPSETWSFADGKASILAGGHYFELACEPHGARRTHPSARMSVPCPLCFPMETTQYVLRIDDLFEQQYEFERVSNAEGSVSGLDYYPDWYDGLVAALMAGSALEVIEQGGVIASFPLTGSGQAIAALRDACN